MGREVGLCTIHVKAMPETFYVIDGHAQIYRAFYAPFRELTSPSGEPTRATYVFCQMLLGLIRDKSPDYLAMVLDSRHEAVFRCEIDPNYKANREPAPEALHLQADRIISIVETMGIATFRVEGFEADDLIATIIERVKNIKGTRKDSRTSEAHTSEDVTVYVVSRDKDLEQLISDRVLLYDPVKEDVLDAAMLVDQKGYSPELAVEVQTLTGDSTDNVPGIVGVGPKTAAKLISQYRSAEAVLAHADELTPRMKERVRAFADQLPVTRKLVSLRRDAPLDFDLSRCRIDAINPAAALPTFEELGFRRLREQIETMAPPTGAKLPQPGETKSVDGEEAVDYQLVDTREKLDAFARKLEKQKRFAFDTETTGLNPVTAELVGVSICWRAGDGYYIPVRGIPGPVPAVEDVVNRLRPVFENPKVAKVGQNLKYDLLVMRQVGVVTAGELFDTMIASFCLDPFRRSHSLDALAQDVLGHEMIPISALIGKGKSQITIDQVDTARTCEYACEDADFTWRLMEALEPQLAGSPVEPLFRETEMPLVEVLTEMENHGVAIDTALLTELSATIETQLIELRQQVHRAAGREFNVDSPKQLAVVLFDELGLGAIRKTKTGRSTDADTLETLARQTDNPIPGLVLKYRELSKLRNTYVDTLPKMVSTRTGRIHTSFSQAVTATGRLSSRDPNLQNIPVRTSTGKRIRAAFIPGQEDNVLLAADYSQIELRVLAHYCKDRALVEAFKRGVDVHRFVAAQVNGVAVEDVTPEQRNAAKAVNFGIIYGQTPFGLSRSLGIPVHQARAFIDTYFMRYPGIRLFIDKCVANVKKRGFAETILGRRRPIQELHSRNPQQRALGERLAVNTVIQGSSADLIKRAMIDIHRELHCGEYTAKMLIQVHDELVFEVVGSNVNQEAEMIHDKMVNAIPLDVPVVVDIGWGPNWLAGK